MSRDLPEIVSAQPMTTRQRVFLRYFTAILIDLVVLNLFAEYWQHATVSGFSISLLAAILLQVLLKLTLALEVKVADYCNAIDAVWARFMRYFSAWFILFASKFVMLGAIYLAFGDNIHFGGPLHGVVAFILVVVMMLAAEELIVRFYRRLG